MTTAANIISDALAEIGVIGASETPSAEDQSFCLRKLNQVLQRWSNSRLAFPTLTEITLVLNGAQAYTIGPTGGTVAARPISVRAASVVDSNGIEYLLQLIPRDEWDAIAQKDVSGGPPTFLWYEATPTNGTVRVYPKASGYTLRLDCQVLLASFTSASSVLTLPEGYESALTLTLADDIAAAFGKQTSADTRRRCAAAMSAIKTTNTEPAYLSVDLGSERFSIERGY